MSLSVHDARYVQDLVYRRTAIVVDDSKNYLIEARLLPLAAEQQLPSVNDLIGAARGGATELQGRIVTAMTTNETSWFRDATPFAALRTMVLPALIAARSLTRTINVWSAACSTGQEPYSIAMVIREHFPELDRWNIRILATDFADTVLARAKTASYQQLEINRGLPAALMTKYFERSGLQWTLKPNIASMVEFRQLNLVEPWALPFRPDIVFLRNVLIYFDIETRRRIFDQAQRTMAADGALFLGAAETTLNVHDGWDRVAQDRLSFYRPRAPGAARSM